MTRLILLVVAVLFSVCRANVMLGGCGTDDYCPGQMISLTCDPDNENVTITVKSPDNVLDTREFNDSTDIGETGIALLVNGVPIMYNKTGESSFRFWTTIIAEMNGYKFQCMDGDNDTDYQECIIGVNTNPVPNPTSIGVESREYCDAVNITWSFASDADTSCVQQLVRKVNEQTEIDIPKTSTYYTVDDPSANGFDICVSVASKNYVDVTNEQFTGPQCVKFNVPLEPTGLMESYNVDDANSDNEIEVTVTWMLPDRSRPGVQVYFITTNITGNDDGNDDDDNEDGSGSGEIMDKRYEFYQTDGNQNMMKLPGAMEGNYYTVKLVAQNCYGNSSETNITFQVVKDDTTDVTPTTPTDEPDTPEPSASPTLDEDEEFPTWAIAVIVVVGVLFLVGILLAICIPIICCCCFGTLLCCAAAEGGKSRDIEMGRKGTHL